MTTTATQRREAARTEYDVFLAQCPSRQLLDRVADKWVALVLCALARAGSGSDAAPVAGRLRYSELRREIAGVSQKMLTQTLRALERDGLVTRTVTPTVPVTVTYELTDLGASLHEAVKVLKAWAQTHMPEVAAHRAAHDATV